jgi:hypothetical protein
MLAANLLAELEVLGIGGGDPALLLWARDFTVHRPPGAHCSASLDILDVGGRGAKALGVVIVYESEVFEGASGSLVGVRAMVRHYWTPPRTVAASCSSSHANTTDFFQTRRRPNLNDAGPVPMEAQ